MHLVIGIIFLSTPLYIEQLNGKMIVVNGDQSRLSTDTKKKVTPLLPQDSSKHYHYKSLTNQKEKHIVTSCRCR